MVQRSCFFCPALILLSPISFSHLPVDTTQGTIRRWHWRDIARGFASPGSTALPACSQCQSACDFLTSRTLLYQQCVKEPLAHVHGSFAGTSECQRHPCKCLPRVSLTPCLPPQTVAPEQTSPPRGPRTSSSVRSESQPCGEGKGSSKLVPSLGSLCLQAVAAPTSASPGLLQRCLGPSWWLIRYQLIIVHTEFSLFKLLVWFFSPEP